MDSDRPPHSRAAATTELFICFTSRLSSSSSSSMKLTKSLLSPGRPARDGPASLSSSLSRRLRPNGSLKAGQASPFFPTTRKRGCAFENPEPSSPKVTCIGQVRVKTKKKVKQSRSRRSGEVSFRKIEGGDGGGIEDKRYSNASAHYHQPPQPQEHRNQRWVHLPVSICEALRTFGAEFSCLFPCKTSCFSSERVGKGEKHDGCGAVFTRWLVSVNDGEGGKRREIELVVGGGDEEEEAASSRRHVFEDIEVKDDRIEVKGQDGHLEEAARVSICIPPKNALLLMRCRSDPMKMADLATRFSWDAPNAVVSQDTEEEIEEKAVVSHDIEEDAVVSQDEPVEEQCEEVEHEVTDQDNPISGEASNENEIADEAQEDLCCPEEIQQEQLPIYVEEEIQEEQLPAEEMAADELQEILEYEEEVESNMSSFEALLDEEIGAEPYDDSQIQDKEEVETEESPICHLSPSTESEEHEDVEQSAEETVLKQTIPNNDSESEERETEAETGRETEAQEAASKREKVLPECLVLMMCEPKLSMEVSKETWVCSRDFIRWLPRNEPLKRRLSIDSKPKAAEPPRSSVIEHKLVNAVAYEPFVLTRCKSEPMRTAAAKLAPESCFWKNAIRKLEPHRRGVGAAGVGF